MSRGFPWISLMSWAVSKNTRMSLCKNNKVSLSGSAVEALHSQQCPVDYMGNWCQEGYSPGHISRSQLLCTWTHRLGIQDVKQFGLKDLPASHQTLAEKVLQFFLFRPALEFQCQRNGFRRCGLYLWWHMSSYGYDGGEQGPSWVQLKDSFLALSGINCVCRTVHPQTSVLD